MNINAVYWGDTFGSRRKLRNPEKNIVAGIEMISRIKQILPENASVAEIDTLYNNINEKKINEYVAKVQRIYDEKLWENTKKPAE